jgi:hypothetical protein
MTARNRGVAFVVWSALAACGGKLDDPGRFAFLLAEGGVSDASAPAPDGGMPGMTVPDAGGGLPGAAVPVCVTNVFAMRCGSAACHGEGALQVDLTSPGVSARLVGQEASAAGMCAGRPLVAPDGSESLLLDKLMDPPPCGSKMPLVGAALASTEVQCLTDWVASLPGGT